MPNARTIQHPGVEINEYDPEIQATVPLGTMGYVMGFADKGPCYQYSSIRSEQEYKDMYGKPKTEAEKYMFITAQSILANGGTPLIARIPYTGKQCTNYKISKIELGTDGTPISIKGADDKQNPLLKELSDFDVQVLTNSTVAYTRALPLKMVSNSTDKNTHPDSTKHIYMSDIIYDALVTNDEINSDVIAQSTLEETISNPITSTTAFVIVDKNKSVANGPTESVKPKTESVKTKTGSDPIISTGREKDENEGYFIAIVDMLDAIKYQKLYNKSEIKNFDDKTSDFPEVITNLYNANNINVTDWSELSIPLFDKYAYIDSVSGKLVQLYPQIPLNDIKFEQNTTTSNIDKKFSSYVIIAVCKTTINPVDNKLAISILEAIPGSIFPEIDSTSNTSTWICDRVNRLSNYIEMFGNTELLKDYSSKFDKQQDIIINTNTNCNFISFARKETNKLIDGSKLNDYIERCATFISNKDDINLNFIVDSGLSNIAQMLDSSGNYNPNSYTGTVGKANKNDVDSSGVGKWLSVVQKLDEISRVIRKDCMTIIDAPRYLTLKGNMPIIRKTQPENTFNKHISPGLLWISGLNSSYVAGYYNWIKTADTFSGRTLWIPPTTKIIGNYIYNNMGNTPWLPPAGVNYGTLTGVLAISHNPAPKDEDQIYLKNWNYIKSYPTDGFIIEGQKTTLTKNSPFNRVNVRLLFLDLERYAYYRSKIFKYQPNNQYTREQYTAMLTTKFEDYSFRGGITRYSIVCDSSNNSNEMIDAGEMRCAMFINPARSVEFILLDFIGTSTGANFNELVY